MKQVTLKKMVIDNFKGCNHREIVFSDNTKISGQNASGKTTILDAFTWLLFNKDSADNEKFAIRPLDEDGKQIDNVDISVSAVIEIDGKDHELHKVQRQNWVKKRGSEEAKFQGNVNSYEIDTYPKKNGEFDAFVAEIINEDVFKMITNPTYFTKLPWKDQRATLMRFVSDISDVDLASGNSEFSILLPDLEKAPSTDDIGKKYGAQKKKLTATLKELPVRIDEVAKQKVELDVAEVELQKADLERKIADCDSRITSAKNNDTESLSSEYKTAKAALDDFERKARNEYEDACRDANDRIRDLDRQIADMMHEIGLKEREVTTKTLRVSDFRKMKEDYTNQYKQIKMRKFERIEFDGKSEICPVCNRRLPDDEIAELHKRFESEQAEREKKFNDDCESELKRVTNAGFKAKEDIEKEEQEISVLNKVIEHLKADLDGTKKAKEDAENSLPQKPDLSSNNEYKSLADRVTAAKAALDGAINNVADTSGIESERSRYKARCDEVIASVARNVEIDERISQLQAEQREVSQKIADVEKILFALEKFVKFKMDRVSTEINSHFDGLRFVLFETQINGGIRECCEVSYNGVRYSDLNNGHKIISGLQIIKALQTLYDISAPIFIDNSEAISTGNMPDMGCQMVEMAVSDDKELLVE